MTHFIKGKIKQEAQTTDLFTNEVVIPTQEESHHVSNSCDSSVVGMTNKPLQFSDEAVAVFDAGRELWKYYHAQKDVNVNASLYDIREYFQGRNDKGRMNARSNDERYTELISELRNKLALLADKIKPIVYEYEFLKE